MIMIRTIIATILVLAACTSTVLAKENTRRRAGIFNVEEQENAGREAAAPRANNVRRTEKDESIFNEDEEMLMRFLSAHGGSVGGGGGAGGSKGSKGSGGSKGSKGGKGKGKGGSKGSKGKGKGGSKGSKGKGKGGKGKGKGGKGKGKGGSTESHHSGKGKGKGNRAL